MQGKLIFSTKDYSHAEREVFSSLAIPGANRLLVSEKYVENFLGLGVAITPSSCYELSLMDALEREELLRHLYAKDGIGMSIGRICIASSDYSPEIYSYDDIENDTELAHFSVKRDERYIIPIIQEIIRINPDIYLFASPWSPPYWMKTGKSMCGGYMRDQYIDCYANYIIKFIKAYAEYGIKISAITPQNETNTQQSGRMPSCIWHPETEANFIKVLRKKLNQNALDVKIWMYDHNFDDVERVVWSLENIEGLKESCNGVAFHYYGGTVEQTAYVKKKYPEMELHFTEAGPRLTENYEFDFCKWGIIIAKTVQAGYQSFTGWNLMLDELGGPNVGPYIGICGGFVTLDSRSKELSYSGQYKAYSHIAPYITPESKLRYITVDDHFGLQPSSYPKQDKKIEGFLIENEDGKKTAVLVNPNHFGMQTQIEIDGVLWYIELQPESISTVEIR